MFYLSQKRSLRLIDNRGGGSVGGYIVIAAMVCVTIIGIVGIFAMLAYLKEKAILKYKNSSKVGDNEISITVDDNKDKNSKN
ncbi:hypothetical protein CKR_2927 [Clostridium kluyveri NBRC 12016]|uniref:Uncharacterized protein n=2 Tax=Clostridium kluyveri TaxID=1534 RepID=A5N2H6_CLOK5|nr:Hypothetical protein CKL_3319 [Clostridium kluyveri DSM 555]BAH07978.1 hypothetical protein CKR_2927 [Clostridium kluyveri NBRC 12016]